MLMHMEDTMKRSFPLASLGGCSDIETRDIIEQAKEELQILEAQQPNRFNYLKLELKSFISLLEPHPLILSENKCRKMLALGADSTSVSISSSATTQASSTYKKRKKRVIENQEMMDGWAEAPKQKSQRVDRLDAVFERARACLDKIQEFKHLISGEN